MAHIGVVLRDYFGEELGSLGDGGFELKKALPDFDDLSYPYLRCIDPYGNTVFSPMQMAAVIPELRRLAASSPSPVLDRVIKLAEACETTIHSTLTFIGD